MSKDPAQMSHNNSGAFDVKQNEQNSITEKTFWRKYLNFSTKVMYLCNNGKIFEIYLFFDECEVGLPSNYSK